MRPHQRVLLESYLPDQTEPEYLQSRSRASLALFGVPPSSGAGPVAPVSLPCFGHPRFPVGLVGDEVDRTRSAEEVEVELEQTLCLHQSCPTRLLCLLPYWWFGQPVVHLRFREWHESACSMDLATLWTCRDAPGQELRWRRRILPGGGRYVLLGRHCSTPWAPRHLHHLLNRLLCLGAPHPAASQFRQRGKPAELTAAESKSYLSAQFRPPCQVLESSPEFSRDRAQLVFGAPTAGPPYRLFRWWSRGIPQLSYDAPQSAFALHGTFAFASHAFSWLHSQFVLIFVLLQELAEQEPRTFLLRALPIASQENKATYPQILPRQCCPRPPSWYYHHAWSHRGSIRAE